MSAIQSRERWERVEALFHAAASTAPDERPVLLDRECGGDKALRAEVEALLARHDSPDPGWDDTPTSPQSAGPHVGGLAPGRRVGRYVIVRRIGAGGMGAVYEATQDSPARTVALKLLTGLDLSGQAARRFEHEALLLGRLRHPGIAQVYDAGVLTPDSPDGGSVPFIAMELVPDARPLVRFADEAGLDTRARLELFTRVCDAVQHAHAKGVIHRDLKPANILVDPSGNPQVIDFGVARALGDRAVTILTVAHTLLGTVAYMSPEQCDPSSDADIRTDAYSLGVVLYELLCGALPYRVDTVTLAEATRIIREQPPRRISAIRPMLKGDLETITLKALEKERERRYQSVADLAADLRRFLDHRPIAARPPSPLYLARRFARRNRALVGAAAAVLAAIIAGGAVSLTFALRAREEARRAERVNAFLLGALGSANPMVPAAVRAELIASDYEPFADWHRSPWPFAGEPGRAAAAADILRAAGRRLEADLADDPIAQGRLADALGITLFRLREPDEPQRLLRLAVRLRTAALGPDHEDTLRSRLHLGEVLDWFDIDESQEIYRSVRETCGRRYGPRDARTLHAERMLANNLFYHHARRDEALDMLAATVKGAPTRDLTAGGDPRAGTSGAHQEPAVLEQASYASHLYVDAGRLDEAEPMARLAAEGLAAALGRRDIRTAEAIDGLSYVLWRRPGATEEAERCAREALAVKSDLFGPGSLQATNSRLRLGNGLAAAGRFAMATDELLIGMAAYADLLGEDDFETLRARGWAGGAMARDGTRPDEARLLLLSAAEGMQRRFGPSYNYTLSYRATAADALAAAGDKPGAAREWDEIARDALLIQRPEHRGHAALFLARAAAALAAAGDPPGARARLLEAIEIDPAQEPAFRAMLDPHRVTPDPP